MVVPRTFRNENERILASYDYTDIVEGTGTIYYMGFTTINNTTTSWKLTSESIRSQNAAYAFSGDAGTFEKVFDLSVFNLPHTVQGSSIITGNYNFVLGFAGRTSYLTIYIMKWDGVTETSLGSARTATLSANSGETDFTFAVDLTRTNFSQGDTLRVKLEVVTTGDAGTNSTWTIKLDPTDATTGLRVGIPYSIDL